MENSNIENPTSELNDFELIKDFEKHKAEFRIDTFELTEHSADGGELKVYHNKNFDYVVFDFWLYGETGRLNYTYWTEKGGDNNFKFIKQLDYDYDKPYYKEGYKTDSIIRYLSYSSSSYRLFDINKKEIVESEQVEKTKTDLEFFFKDVIEDVEFLK